jgi:hypothetical protein
VRTLRIFFVARHLYSFENVEQNPLIFASTSRSNSTNVVINRFRDDSSPQQVGVENRILYMLHELVLLTHPNNLKYLHKKIRSSTPIDNGIVNFPP